jgi:hypothetical protein
MEEYFKVLRSGAAERTFQGLARAGMIEHISPEMEEGLSADFFSSLARLDAYRAKFAAAPDTLTTTILVGALLVPLGLMDDANRKFGVNEQWYPALGRLPIPRKDVERLGQLLHLLPRLHETSSPSRAQHALLNRSAFRDALTWLEIYGDAPDVAAHWREVLKEAPAPAQEGAPTWFRQAPAAGDSGRGRRRRRRRRRSMPTAI